MEKENRKYKGECLERNGPRKRGKKCEVASPFYREEHGPLLIFYSAVSHALDFHLYMIRGPPLRMNRRGIVGYFTVTSRSDEEITEDRARGRHLRHVTRYGGFRGQK